MAEGQLKETMARKHIAFAALPDGNSVICMQYAKAQNRTYVSSVKGILWNVPNDIFNGRQRLFTHANGQNWLQGGDYARTAETIDAGNWVNADGKMGLASLRPLTIVRSGKRQVEIKGRENSGTLYAEEICAPYQIKKRWYDRGEEILDARFVLGLGDQKYTKETAESLFTADLEGLYSLGVTGKDGKQYLLVANFDETDKIFKPDCLNKKSVTCIDGKELTAEYPLHSDDAILLILE